MKYTMKRWRRAVYRDKRTAVAVHGVYGEQRKGFEPSRRKAVSLFLLEVYELADYIYIYIYIYIGAYIGGNERDLCHLEERL